MNHKKRIKKGLTPIETLLTVVIIGILVVIALPNFLSTREIARLRACAENMKIIETAVEGYAIHRHLSGEQSLLGKLSELAGNL